jgi:hypothetical protein
MYTIWICTQLRIQALSRRTVRSHSHSLVRLQFTVEELTKRFATDYSSSPKKRKATGSHQAAPIPTSAPPSGRRYTSPVGSTTSTPGRTRGHTRQRSDISTPGSRMEPSRFSTLQLDSRPPSRGPRHDDYGRPEESSSQQPPPPQQQQQQPYEFRRYEEHAQSFGPGSTAGAMPPGQSGARETRRSFQQSSSGRSSAEAS